MMENVVELKTPLNDADLVESIRETLRKLCDSMNEAETRGIDVSFNIGRANPADNKSHWILASEKITKNL